MTKPKEQGKKGTSAWDPEIETAPALRKAHDNIKQKCQNPKSHEYKNYGGRGISLHAPWAADRALFVEAVIKEIGLKPAKSYSLDRIDNDGNYVPGNLRWASKSEQAANRRSSATVLLKGIEMFRADVARELGVSAATMGRQLRDDPRANPRAVKFEEYWLQRLRENDHLPIAFDRQRRRLVADMLSRLRVEVNLAPAVRYGIQFWEEFAEEAAEAGGLRIYPKQPDLQYFLTHIGTAVSFGNAKLAKVEAARSRQRQAQLEREADARQEQLEAEAMERDADAWIERHGEREQTSTGLSFLQSIAVKPSGCASVGQQFQNQKPMPQLPPNLQFRVNSEPEPRSEACPTRSYDQPGYSSWDDDDLARAPRAEIEEIIPLDEPEPGGDRN